MRMFFKKKTKTKTKNYRADFSIASDFDMSSNFLKFVDPRAFHILRNPSLSR